MEEGSKFKGLKMAFQVDLNESSLPSLGEMTNGGVVAVANVGFYMNSSSPLKTEADRNGDGGNPDNRLFGPKKVDREARNGPI